MFPSLEAMVLTKPILGGLAGPSDHLDTLATSANTADTVDVSASGSQRACSAFAPQVQEGAPTFEVADIAEARRWRRSVGRGAP